MIVLFYTNKNLGVDEVALTNKTVIVSTKNKVIKIASSNELIDTVFVYDFSGKQIYEKEDVVANDLLINNLLVLNRPLIIKVKLQSGQFITKKIIY